MGAFGLFVALVPVFLIAANVRWVINFPPLYSYGFDTYNIVQFTGVPRDELISAGRQIRDYFNNGEERLDVRVQVNGIRWSLYNEREVQHMEDVRGLVQGVYRVSEFAALYLVAFAAVGFGLYRRRFTPQLAWAVGLGGLATLALVMAVGLGSLVGFDRLFLAFHLVSFSNDLWQLDPSRDYLIAMFPQAFFFDATMLIAFSIVIEAALAAVPLYFLWWRPRQAGSTVVDPQPDPC